MVTDNWLEVKKLKRRFSSQFHIHSLFHSSLMTVNIDYQHFLSESSKARKPSASN